jgi:iron complex transport system substrate-binding protein
MRVAAAAFLALSVAATPALAAPARIVSIHLCADQLVVALADRAQIASVSWHAADPAQSFVADRAAGLPKNYGRAEEVLALNPDLVLAGAYSGRETKALLRRLGVAVIDLDLPTSFADIRRQTLAAAGALGHPERGRALIADMDAKLAATQRTVGALPAASAILLQPGGVTMGRGFLEDEMLRAAGLDNLAAQLGIAGQGTVSMERLIAAKPGLIVIGLEPDAPPSLSSRMITNPTLKRATGARIVSLPPILWTCGGWFTAEAVDRLADARRAAPSP